MRNESRPPFVGIPPRSLNESADWTLVDVGGARDLIILVPGEEQLALGVEEGRVDLGEAKPVRATSLWRIVPVADGSQLNHVVSAADPQLGLASDGPAGRLTLSPVGSNPLTMWHIAGTCIADARSLHLRYPMPAETAVWYNEISPRDAPPGTYFCTSGFSGGPDPYAPRGYAGLQARSDGSRRAIFSVWHRMLDEVTPDRNALAKITAANARAETTGFAGEGSGQSIRIPFEWTDADFVRFVLAAHAEDGNTAVSAYVSRWREPWLHIGTITRRATGGRLIDGGYAFVEDFLRNGNEEGIAAESRSPYLPRRAVFANPWAGASAHRLEPIDSVRVTAYSPHPLENLNVEQVTDQPTFAVLAGTGLPPEEAQIRLGTQINAPLRTSRPAPILPDEIRQP